VQEIEFTKGGAIAPSFLSQPELVQLPLTHSPAPFQMRIGVAGRK